MTCLARVYAAGVGSRCSVCCRQRATLCTSASTPGSGEDVGAAYVDAAAAADGERTKKKEKRRKVKFDPYTPPPPPESFPAYEPKDFFRYEILHTSRKPGSRARVGRIHTPHGIVDTPGFVAVATNGALKAVDHDIANDAGQQLMFCNTYHLLLQPGPDVIQEMGGLHKFIKRNRPIITDSGGFQVFSLAYGSIHDELNMKARSKKHNSMGPTMLKCTEEGVLFRSYRDGRRILLTPESTVQAQKAYGSDIIIPLDELHPYHIDRQAVHKCMLRSHRWEARSLREHLNDVKQQAMYAVVHGGVDRELRAESAGYLTRLPFDGYAVGGALGKDRDELVQVLQWTMPLLPYDKPNHLLGIADEPSIWASAALGVDTFDSCYPTRIARHGTLLTRKGVVHIRKTMHARDDRPIDQECKCPTCRRHSRAFLHHLYKACEPLSDSLLSIHNIQYMNDLMANIRQKIAADEL